jgi:hypothetical protein
VQRLLQVWPRIAVEVIATNESKNSAVDSRIGATGGPIGHRMAADKKSTLEGIKLDSEVSERRANMATGTATEGIFSNPLDSFTDRGAYSGAISPPPTLG